MQLDLFTQLNGGPMTLGSHDNPVLPKWLFEAMKLFHTDAAA